MRRAETILVKVLSAGLNMMRIGKVIECGKICSLWLFRFCVFLACHETPMMIIVRGKSLEHSDFRTMLTRLIETDHSMAKKWILWRSGRYLEKL